MFKVTFVSVNVKLNRNKKYVTSYSFKLEIKKLIIQYTFLQIKKISKLAIGILQQIH